VSNTHNVRRDLPPCPRNQGTALIAHRDSRESQRRRELQNRRKRSRFSSTISTVGNAQVHWAKRRVQTVMDENLLRRRRPELGRKWALTGGNRQDCPRECFARPVRIVDDGQGRRTEPFEVHSENMWAVASVEDLEPFQVCCLSPFKASRIPAINTRPAGARMSVPRLQTLIMCHC
jgi:hypothetical protein